MYLNVSKCNSTCIPKTISVISKWSEMHKTSNIYCCTVNCWAVRLHLVETSLGGPDWKVWCKDQVGNSKWHTFHGKKWQGSKAPECCWEIPFLPVLLGWLRVNHCKLRFWKCPKHYVYRYIYIYVCVCVFLCCSNFIKYIRPYVVD